MQLKCIHTKSFIYSFIYLFIYLFICENETIQFSLQHVTSKTIFNITILSGKTCFNLGISIHRQTYELIIMLALPPPVDCANNDSSSKKAQPTWLSQTAWTCSILHVWSSIDHGLPEASDRCPYLPDTQPFGDRSTTQLYTYLMYLHYQKQEKWAN